MSCFVVKAKDYCNELNATLVYLSTDDEHDAVRRLVTEYGVRNGIWTALRVGEI